jgi:hypothetical protein
VGRNVVLDKKWGAPTISNGGVSLAKEIDTGGAHPDIWRCRSREPRPLVGTAESRAVQ